MLTSVYREIPNDSIEGIKLKDGTAVDYLGSLIVNGLTVPKTGFSGTGGINGSTFTIGATEQILSASASILNTQYFMAANSAGSVVYAIITGTGNYGNMQLKDNAATRMYLKTDPTALSYINFLGGLVIGDTAATFTAGVHPNYIAQVVGNFGVTLSIVCYGPITGGAVSTLSGASLQTAKTHYDTVTGNPHQVLASEVTTSNSWSGSDVDGDLEDAYTSLSFVFNSISIASATDGTIANESSSITYRIVGNSIDVTIYFKGDTSSSPTYITVDLTDIPGVTGATNFGLNKSVGVLSIGFLGSEQTIFSSTSVSWPGKVRIYPLGGSLPNSADVRFFITMSLLKT